MSVLQNKRSTSKMEYVSNGYAIEHKTLDFVKRLTPKNAKIYQTYVSRLAMLQADIAYAANEIYPTNTAEYQIRHILFSTAKSILSLLDTRLAGVYEALMENPQEAFSRKNGSAIDKTEAIKILDRMAEELGCAIDKQVKLLRGIIDADKKRGANAPKADTAIDASLQKLIQPFTNLLF